jgi:DNA-binding NarL/FixJ family response regulator
LVKAIRQVVNGGKYVSQNMAEVFANRLGIDADQPLHEALSEREFQVLRMIGSGMTATGIADTLSLSVKTIATYRSRILVKLKLRNTTEIIQYALKNHLVE